MRTKGSPRRGLAWEISGGYPSARVEADRSVTREGDLFTIAQAELSLLAAAILGVLREGSGAAAHVTIGGRPLRRGYAGAKMCRVRLEGVHSQNRPKDTSIGQGLETPRGDQGKGCVRMTEGQGTFFPPAHDRPTPDSIYLGAQIDAKWKSHRLTPPALQKLANAYGAGPLENAIRLLYGFPPQDAIRSAYAYLETMLKEGLV